MKHSFFTPQQFINAAKSTTFLYKNIWKEHSLALLHAPAEVDKTEMALDIVSRLDKNRCKVLYVNIDGKAGQHMGKYAISDNCLFFNPAYASQDDMTDYADLVLEAVEQAISEAGVNTVVIDSLSRMAALSFRRNASVAYLMKRIAILQRRAKVSVLVIANTPSKSTAATLRVLSDCMIDASPAMPSAEQPQPATRQNLTSDRRVQPERTQASDTRQHEHRPKFFKANQLYR